MAGLIRRSAYRPAWWLPGPHLMTIAPAILRPTVPLATRRERWELEDGDFVDLDWTDDPDPRSPLVLVLHGLEGSIESPYARGVLREVAARRLGGVLMHFRGCSGEPNRLRRAYHSGETDDLRALVGLVRRRFPERPLLAVGYSLGGNVLLKYLGEEGGSSPLAGAVAVSVPMVLKRCAERLERGISRAYAVWLLHSLKASYSKKAARVELGLGIGRKELGSIKSLRAFDERITAPLHGFAGADAYYAAASSRQFLQRIATATVILHAEDDPFMTRAVIPEAHELSPAVTLELSAAGGHVGFVAGKNPAAPDYWLERRVPDILCELAGAQQRAF